MGKLKDAPATVASPRRAQGVGMFERYRFWFSADRYKRTQGRRLRLLTFGSIVGVFALIAWTLSEQAWLDHPVWQYLVPLVVLSLGSWFGFRLIHWPRFADFLVATEAEMNKVTWPRWETLRRATVVVLATMFVLTAFLLLCDMVWYQFLTWIGVLRSLSA